MGNEGKDAYYFSHDSNARNDLRILAMRTVYKNEGYGLYWMIIEILREQSDYKLPITEYIFDTLAMQTHCERIKVEQFMNDCVNKFKDEKGSLLSTDGKFFWSASLIRRMDKLDVKRDKAKKAAEKRWDKKKKNANALPTHCQPNAIYLTDLSKVNILDLSKLNITTENVVSVFQNNIHPITPLEFEKISADIKDTSPEVVFYAVYEAVMHSKRNMSYIEGIISNLISENITKLEE